MGGMNRNKSTRMLIAIVLGLALLLAGCGSMGRSGSSANDAAGQSAGSAAHNTAFESSVANSDSNSGFSYGEIPASADARSNTDSGSLGSSDAHGDAANEPGFGADEVNAGIHRKLIYRAYVTMEVADYGAVQSEIRNLIQLSGGYLLEFNETNSEYERGGTFVIKVPSTGFMTFLSRLEEFSGEHRYQSSISGEDVTEEYVDLEARLKAQQVTEQRLIAFMEKASRADELVEFSRELGRVQQEIEQIKGRMRYLEQNVAYSTIEARVYEKSATASRLQQDNAPFGERLSSSLMSVLQGISIVLQELVIFVVAALPIVLVLAIFASPFIFWYWYHRREQVRQNISRSRPGGANELPSAEPPQTLETEDVAQEQQDGQNSADERENKENKEE